MRRWRRTITGEMEMVRTDQDGEESDFPLPLQNPNYEPSSSKRRKSVREDRISALPDCVLLHILSFLPAQEVIRTGVLSKRWTRLWESSQNLIFRCDKFRVGSFVDFINSTLVRYSSDKVKKFLVHFPSQELDRECDKMELFPDSAISLWLRFATRRNVEKISLKFCEKWSDFSLLYGPSYRPYTIPNFLLSSPSLIELSTRNCEFEHNAQFSWGSLRKLTIGHAALKNSVLEKILLGSLKLEYLRLQYCYALSRIDVSSNSVLETLVIEGITDDPGEELEIIVPNLKSLEISGFWCGKMCRLLDASSLVNASLDLSLAVKSAEGWNALEELVDMVKQLLQQIKHAKKLTLGSECIDVLSLTEDRALSSPLVNCNLKCLTLRTPINGSRLQGIASLLYNSPTLEKLVINRNCGNTSLCQDHEGLLQSFGANFWTSQKRSFNCLHNHLKTTEIIGFSNEEFEDNLVGAFLQYLLQNARVLEKMVVYSNKFHLKSSDAYNKMARKLLACPKASPHAVILLPRYPADC